MLDIKNKKSIEEALDSMIEGELMENENGVEIAEMGRKIKATKYCKIKHLSDLCVIHLKRIEFNMKTQTRRKLNDYCSFPDTIDFSKWMATENSTTEKGKQCNEFTLVGIILHAGFAEAGHYTSYIKERNKQHPNYGKWFEFNDLKVKEVDKKDFETNCFGNIKSKYTRKKMKEEGEDDIGDLDEDYTADYDLSPSAYMLIYERIEKAKGKKGDENIEEEEEEEDKLIQAEVSSKWYCDNKFTACLIDMGKAYLKEPGSPDTNKWAPITEFILSKEISMKGYCDRLDSETVGSYLGKLILQFITEIQGRITFNYFEKTIDKKLTTDSSDTPFILEILSNNNTLLCFYYLSYLLDSQRKRLLFSILIKHPIPEVRECFSNMILIAIQTILMSEQTYLTDYNADLKSYSSLATRFILTLFYEGLPIAQQHHLTSEHYFITLKNAIGNVSHDAAALISGKPGRTLTILIDFIANKKLSLIDNSERFQIETSSFNCLPAMQFLNTILRCGATKSMKELKRAPDYSLFPLEDLVNIPEEELLLWFDGNKWNFLDLLQTGQKDLIIILIIMTWGDEIRTKLMIDSIGRELVAKKGNPTTCEKILSLAKELINISGDNNAELRFSSLFFGEISILKSSLLGFVKANMGGENDKWAIDIL